MKQTNNQKSLQLYFSFLLLAGYFAAEPIFLKLFFQTYLPDFYYRSLTVPLSGVLGIAAIQQWRLYQGYYPITGTIILRQLKSRSFTQHCLTNISAIRRAVLPTCQALKCLGLDFWEGTKFRYQFWSEVSVSILNWKQKSLTTRHQQTNRNSYSKKIATEPMTLFWRNKTYVYCFLAELSQLLLLFYIPVSFWLNVPLWGWFNTSLTFAWEAFVIFIYLYLCNVYIMKAIKRQKLAEESGEDLLELSNMLESLEIEGWQFKYRVTLPKNKKKDIDVVAISPNGKYFAIELKSHIGDVFLNSKSKELRRQYGKNLESVPFEQDFFAQLNANARRLKTSNELQNKPQKILLFWRATVKINKKDRVKRGVLISSKESLINDLRKRNNDLS
jgi:Nuclease-related domain